MSFIKKMVLVWPLLLVPITFSNAFGATVNVEQCAGASSVTNTCFFVPDEVTINVGDIVIWTNSDSATHTVTSGSADEPGNWGQVFDSGLGKPGSTFQHKFVAAGEYPYLCQLHPWMFGKVIVEEAPSMPKVGKPGEIVQTNAGRFGVQLIQTPPIIETGITAKFYLTFFKGGEDRLESNIVYDFAVVMDGRKIVDRKQIQSLTGDSVEEVSFAGDQSGQFTVMIDNVHFITEPPDPTEDDAAFMVEVMAAEEVKGPAMPTMTQRTAGERFDVEVVFSPAVIEPDKSQSFALSFFNAKKEFVERTVFYDFSIVKDGQELVTRKGQLAPTGTAIEKFTFTEEQAGPVTLKVDNVRILGEAAESADDTSFSVTVVPEFPIGIMLVVTSAIAAMVLVGRFKKLPHL